MLGKPLSYYCTYSMIVEFFFNDLIQKGQRYLQDSDYDMVEQILSEIDTTFPFEDITYIQAQILRVRLLYHQNKLEDSLDLLNLAEELNTTNNPF